jgi:hypothetical protein
MQNKKKCVVNDLDRPMSAKEACQLSKVIAQREYSGLRNFLNAKATDPALIHCMRPGDRVLSVSVKMKGPFKPTHRLILAEFDDLQCELQFGVTNESLAADEASDDWRHDRYREFLKADRIRREVSVQRESARRERNAKSA